MITTKSLTALTTTIASIAALRGLGETKVAARLRASAEATQSRFSEMGKMIGILAENWSGKGTLAALVSKKVGEDFDAESIGHGYKYAKVMLALVLPGLVPEAKYDELATTHACDASASLNLVEKSEMTDAQKTAVVTEIAGLLSERPEDLGAKLVAIKKRLQPAKDEKTKGEKDGEGSGSGEKAEKATAEIAAKLEVAQAKLESALGAIRILSGMTGRLIAISTEEQLAEMAGTLEGLAKLPAVVAAPIKAILDERVKALTSVPAAETVAA